jgi:hypothetical protein
LASAPFEHELEHLLAVDARAMSEKSNGVHAEAALPSSLEPTLSPSGHPKGRIPPLAQRVQQLEWARRQRAYAAALLMATVGILAAIPALWEVGSLRMPDWSAAALVLSLFQIGYAAWIAVFPHWVTLWVGMIASTITAALYGMIMALVMMSPAGRPLLLDLADVQRTAPGWCLAVVLITSIVIYCTGRLATRWRREAALAAKSTGI